MDKIFISKVLINLSLKYTSFPASSNSLSSSLISKFPDMIPQIEKDIKKNKNKEEIDGEGKTNDTENNNTRRRKIT